MEVQHLRCLVAVAEELHFGRAAHRLHLTASPVSRAIKELEREVGTALFVRGYHQVELTEAGRALHARAVVVLRELDDLTAFAVALRGTPERRLRLGGTHLAPPACMDSLVELAETVLHRDRLDIRLAVSAELIADVVRGELDLALVQLPHRHVALETLELARFPFVVAMYADDPLAGSSSLTLADLAGRTVTLGPVSAQPVASTLLRDRLARAGVTSFHEMPDHDMAMMLAHLRRTGGLTLTIDPAAGGASRVLDDPSVALVPLAEDRFELVIGLVWRAAPGTTDDPVNALVEAARRAVSAAQASSAADLSGGRRRQPHPRRTTPGTGPTAF